MADGKSADEPNVDQWWTSTKMWPPGRCTNGPSSTLMWCSTSRGCNTLCSSSCCYFYCSYYIFSATLLVHLSWSCRFLCTFLLHSSRSSLCLLWCPRQAHSLRWKMLKMRERRLVGHWEWRTPWFSPTFHWGAQVITFNEIWASQRHERLQICGLCKNLIFMNLVKEKLRSASYRRYVWVDMHPSVDPWGPEGLYSDWAMHLSSYKEWHRVVCARLSVKAANTSRTSPFASQECQLSVSYGSVWP